jgi:HK97 family phage major capsid protein
MKYSIVYPQRYYQEPGVGFDTETESTAVARQKTTAVERLEEIRRQRAVIERSTPRVGSERFERDPRGGFPNPREFLLAVMQKPGDPRLRRLAVQDDQQAGGERAFLLPRAFNPSFLVAVGSDEQGVYSDPYGGFLTEKRFIPSLLQLGFEGDPTSGRTQSVPMGTPTVSLPARVDKDHTSSVSGGFTVTRKPETVAATDSRASFELVTLKASSLFGLAYASEEILTDSVISFVTLIEAGFRDQFAHHMLEEKLRGLGGAEFIGALNGDATLAIARTAANRILGTDVLAMRRRCWGYRDAIWIANHDTFAEVYRVGAAAYDDEGATPLSGAGVVYATSMRDDRPDSLLGRPIFYSEYASTLGSAGDLILGNWSEYLEGLYQPLRTAESIHVRWVEHERAFKFWLRNAGAPWWRTALTPKNSTETQSPFVR